MKIRQGFVSNSSSSSFIAVGDIKKYEKYEDIEDLIENSDKEMLVGSEDGLNDKEYCEPIHFTESGDDYMDNGRILITEDMVGKYVIYGTKMS